MKRITALTALTLTGLALAAPAHADNGGHARGGITVNNRSLSTANLCERALALVPVAAPWTGNAVDDACNDRPHEHLHG
jgi:hypothetical protein